MTCSEYKFHTYIQIKNSAQGVYPRGSTPRGRVRVLGINPCPPTPQGQSPRGGTQILFRSN